LQGIEGSKGEAGKTGGGTIVIVLAPTEQK
jgi:hypothetical protein